MVVLRSGQEGPIDAGAVNTIVEKTNALLETCGIETPGSFLLALSEILDQLDSERNKIIVLAAEPLVPRGLRITIQDLTNPADTQELEIRGL